MLADLHGQLRHFSLGFEIALLSSLTMVIILAILFFNKSLRNWQCPVDVIKTNLESKSFGVPGDGMGSISPT